MRYDNAVEEVFELYSSERSGGVVSVLYECGSYFLKVIHIVVINMKYLYLGTWKKKKYFFRLSERSSWERSVILGKCPLFHFY